jgi:hypothetical protein
MNLRERDDWRDEVLREILAAIAADADLVTTLVFKGARVLQMHLPGATRRSLDLDANLSREFIERYPGRQRQADVLRAGLERALQRHFDAQSPSRYRVASARVEPSPPGPHPLGWDGFCATLRIDDAARPRVSNLPALTLDLVAPESHAAASIIELRVGHLFIRAHRLERVAGEKLRAFLSTTTTATAKLGAAPRPLRVKDLVDLHTIAAHVPVADGAFWDTVAQEFSAACRSRRVDCLGWSTFAVAEDLARRLHESDPALRQLASFDDVWASIREIVRRIEAAGALPVEST